jgi:hypothetical protein
MKTAAAICHPGARQDPARNGMLCIGLSKFFLLDPDVRQDDNIQKLPKS